MNKLLVTYADGSTEQVSSDLSAEAYFDSRFGGQPADIRAKCSVVVEGVKPASKPAAVKK